MKPLPYTANIARGTTDPEIDSETWTKLGNNMTLLALIANFATRQHHLHKFQIWPPDGATYNDCKFGHQMAPLAFFCKFGHQMAPLAKVPNLATR